MKIKNLKLKNFAKFIDFNVEFKGNITRLIGVNGSGKTTVGLTAIWACLKGITEKNSQGQLMGERFRFIGSSRASADIEITLIDEKKNNAEIKIKNHITKQSNQISFEAPDNYPISNEWLNGLLSVAFLSAKNFTSMSSKEQAILLGIDTTKFDIEIKQLKQTFTDVNRDLKNIGELIEVKEVIKVSISDLIAQKDEIDLFNRNQEKLAESLVKGEKYIADKKEIIFNLELQLQELQEVIKIEKENKEKAEVALNNMSKPETRKNVDDILHKITTAEENNTNSIAYYSYLAKKTQKELISSELEANKVKQGEVSERRTKFIQSFDFGIPGVSADEEGQLMIDSRPVKEPYFSKGELEIIVAKLHAHMNPEMKVRFIDDFELLDDANQIKLVDKLLKEGFQIITAECHLDKQTENTIILKDCKIAGEL